LYLYLFSIYTVEESSQPTKHANKIFVSLFLRWRPRSLTHSMFGKFEETLDIRIYLIAAGRALNYRRLLYQGCRLHLPFLTLSSFICHSLSVHHWNRRKVSQPSFMQKLVVVVVMADLSMFVRENVIHPSNTIVGSTPTLQSN